MSKVEKLEETQMQAMAIRPKEGWRRSFKRWNQVSVNWPAIE
jgi:hypothetical protein